MTGDELNPEDRVSLSSGLWWGVKRSFIDYLLGLPDGRCSADDGSELVDGDLFRYSVDIAPSFDPLTAVGILKFRGDVRFAGHEWMLFVRIANPWLEVRPGNVVMTVEGSPPDEPPERRSLVSLTLRWETQRRLIGENVRLTQEGSELFGGVYSAEETFDDLVVQVAGDQVLPKAVELD